MSVANNGGLPFSDALRPSVSAKGRYGELPLQFETNLGQNESKVKFISRVGLQSLYLTSTEAVLTLARPNERGAALHMRFVGANPASRISGLDELPGKVNYFVGSNPAKWHANIPTYRKVLYQDLYPGIDLLYYGDQRQLEYDFIVHPGADPGRIALDISGEQRMQLAPNGDLVLHTAKGTISALALPESSSGADALVVARTTPTACTTMAGLEMLRPAASLNGLARFSLKINERIVIPVAVLQPDHKHRQVCRHDY